MNTLRFTTLLISILLSYTTANAESLFDKMQLADQCSANQCAANCIMRRGCAARGVAHRVNA
jgi:hypothetical protein